MVVGNLLARRRRVFLDRLPMAFGVDPDQGCRRGHQQPTHLDLAVVLFLRRALGLWYTMVRSVVPGLRA